MAVTLYIRRCERAKKGGGGDEPRKKGKEGDEGGDKGGNPALSSRWD